MSMNLDWIILAQVGVFLAALLLAEPAPEVHFSGLTQNALEFELYAYPVDPGQALRVASDIRDRIVGLFRQHGVELPLPPREVLVEVYHSPAESNRDAGLADGAD